MAPVLISVMPPLERCARAEQARLKVACLERQALEQSPGLRHMLRSPAAGAPRPGAAPGPECEPSPNPDPTASPSTPAAHGRTTAPGLPAEADPGAGRLRQASGGAASTTGRGGAAGEGEHRATDRNRHADGGALGGQRSRGQAAPDSPSVHADGSTGREGVRRGAGGGQGSELEAVVLGHHMVDFWTNVCVCHTLIVEACGTMSGAGPPVYQVCSSGHLLGFLGFRVKSPSCASTCARLSVVQTGYHGSASERQRWLSIQHSWHHSFLVVVSCSV